MIAPSAPNCDTESDISKTIDYTSRIEPRHSEHRRGAVSSPCARRLRRSSYEFPIEHSSPACPKTSRDRGLTCRRDVVLANHTATISCRRFSTARSRKTRLGGLPHCALDRPESDRDRPFFPCGSRLRTGFRELARFMQHPPSNDNAARPTGRQEKVARGTEERNDDVSSASNRARDGDDRDSIDQ